MSVTINIKGIENVKRRFKSVMQGFNNPQLYRDLGELERLNIREVHQAEGQPKWIARKGEYPWSQLNETGESRDLAEMSCKRVWLRPGMRERVLPIYSTHRGAIHNYGLGYQRIYGVDTRRDFVTPRENTREKMRNRIREEWNSWLAR